jgi:hypothetical protein
MTADADSGSLGARQRRFIVNRLRLPNTMPFQLQHIPENSLVPLGGSGQILARVE